MKKLSLILFALSAVLLMTGCKCHFKDNDGEFDSYQELALRNDFVHLGYFAWTGYSEKRKVEQNQEMTTIFRFGLPVYINGMLPYSVNGAAFSPLLNFDCGGINGVAFSPLLFTGYVNGIAIAPLFAGNIIMNGISAAPINFHGGSFGGLFLGMVNCRGLWSDKGGIDGQKQLPKAACSFGVVNLDFCFGQYSQLGVFNYSNGVPYFQLGVINTAEKKDADHFALQLGLLNDNGKYILPLLNMTW